MQSPKLPHCDQREAGDINKLAVIFSSQSLFHTEIISKSSPRGRSSRENSPTFLEVKFIKTTSERTATRMVFVERSVPLRTSGTVQIFKQTQKQLTLSLLQSSYRSLSCVMSLPSLSSESDSEDSLVIYHFYELTLKKKSQKILS
jgi:hypothetical protein